MAYEKKRPDEALRMLGLARESFPDNLQITLQMAQLLASQGETEAALDLIETLQKLPWSQVYYPQMPEALTQFVDNLKNAEAQE